MLKCLNFNISVFLFAWMDMLLVFTFLGEKEICNIIKTKSYLLSDYLLTSQFYIYHVINSSRKTLVATRKVIKDFNLLELNAMEKITCFLR